MVGATVDAGGGAVVGGFVGGTVLITGGGSVVGGDVVVIDDSVVVIVVDVVVVDEVVVEDELVVVEDDVVVVDELVVEDEGGGITCEQRITCDTSFPLLGVYDRPGTGFGISSLSWPAFNTNRAQVDPLGGGGTVNEALFTLSTLMPVSHQ